MGGKSFSKNKDDLQPGETHTFIQSAKEKHMNSEKLEECIKE